jgi:hypothetical protein
MEKKRYPDRQIPTVKPDTQRRSDKRRETKNFLIFSAVCIFVFVWVILPITIGMDHAMPNYSQPWRGQTSKCVANPPLRVESLFPLYRLGCWLGGEKGKNYYYDETEAAKK